MERELKGAVRNRVKTQAIDGLVSANNIDVPTALVDGEIDVLRRQAAQRLVATRNKLLNCHANCSKNKLSAVSLLVCCWAK